MVVVGFFCAGEPDEPMLKRMAQAGKEMHKQCFHTFFSESSYELWPSWLKLTEPASGPWDFGFGGSVLIGLRSCFTGPDQNRPRRNTKQIIPTKAGLKGAVLVCPPNSIETRQEKANGNTTWAEKINKRNTYSITFVYIFYQFLSYPDKFLNISDMFWFSLTKAGWSLIKPAFLSPGSWRPGPTTL